MGRIVLHSDLNAFYASVETLLNPTLRGKAVAVCGSEEDRHGIVLAKSEKAKKAGVKTGQANWEARQCCADLITVPPHYDQYVKYSRLVQSIYKRYTDLVEPFGMDECWLDVTGSQAIYGSGVEIAESIRQTIKDELGLTVSIGVSFNKTLAKLGSDMKKPDAITVLDEAHWRERVWPLPASELLFVGRSTTRKLMDRCIYTIGDMAHADPALMQSWFGKNGLELWAFANGMERHRVMPIDFVSPVKSVGHGITCNCDLKRGEDVWKVILELSQDIGHRLRIHKLAARGVKLFVRDNGLNLVPSHQLPTPYPTQSPMEIAQAARILFDRTYSWNHPVRAVTVTAINLVPRDQPMQLSLFHDDEKRVKQQKLDDCIDDIRRRFGNRSVYSASLMGDLHMPGDGRHEVKMPGMMYT